MFGVACGRDVDSGGGVRSTRGDRGAKFVALPWEGVGSDGEAGGVIAARPLRCRGSGAKSGPDAIAVAACLCKAVSQPRWLPYCVALSMLKADLCEVDNSSKPKY